MRKIIDMDSQSLNSKGIEYELTNVFHQNLVESSITRQDIPNIVEKPSTCKSHDEDGSLTQVSI